jgi:hypothetical protein
MFALGVTLLGVGILGVISLIPLYLNKTPVDPLGESEYKSASMNDIPLCMLLLSF